MFWFFFPVLKPRACSRQSRCLDWTYKLPGGQQFSIKLSPLSVAFPQRPFNLVKRPQLKNSAGVRFRKHPACSLYRDRKISPKFFRPKFFRGRPRGMSVPKCLFYPGFGGPDRSFWPDVRRDVRPKTSVFGLIFRVQLINSPFFARHQVFTLLSGVNKSARERIGRQNLSQKVPSKKGSLGVIFSPRKYRENAHSKSANFERRHSGGHLLGRPLLFTSEVN